MLRNFLLFLPLFIMAAPDHLIFTELVMEPSTAEYVIISNPTASAINLSDYYITDATDIANGKYYYNLPSGVDYWSGAATDFIVRFPDTTLGAGASISLCLDGESAYNGDLVPDLWLMSDMLPAMSGQSTIGTTPILRLSSSAETLILFHWDGVTTTVQDVDYLIWGDNSHAIDKSGIGTYANDTPVASQSVLPVHTTGNKLIRSNASDEGTETLVGGNGITGHDETSENLASTWSIVDVAVVKPVIKNISSSPTAPATTESITITADVTDSTALTQVNLIYNFPAGVDPAVTTPMSNTAGDTYSVTIPATGVEGDLVYYIQATNTQGLTRTSLKYTISIADPPPPVTIQTIREDFNTYNGQIVNLNVVVAIGSGITRTDRTEVYVQDNSGYGIVLSASGLLSPALVQGDSINLVGEVSEYLGTIQIQNFTTSLLDTGRPVPGIRTLSSSEVALAENQGSFVKIWGAVQSRSDGIGGGSNIGIEDADGLLTVRIWDTTHLLDDPSADSLLQVGNLVQVFGVASEYNGDGQLLAAYSTDVQVYKEGEDSDGETRLLVAPYPFVPKLAEKIQYSYKFPANSRVTLRIFDLSGHFITTLFEDYRSLALEVTKTWDGRNEISQFVPPGTYIMHLETVNRSTGEIKTDMAPVVIGTAN